MAELISSFLRICNEKFLDCLYLILQINPTLAIYCSIDFTLWSFTPATGTLLFMYFSLADFKRKELKQLNKIQK